MKILKLATTAAVVGMLGLSMTACGATSSGTTTVKAKGYSGEGVVVKKNAEKKNKSKKIASSNKRYHIIIDAENEEANRSIEVKQNQYDKIEIGQYVVVANDVVTVQNAPVAP